VGRLPRAAGLLIVRRAGIADAPALAGLLAAVAEEGFLGLQPPVDVEVRAQAIREMITAGPPVAVWTLECDGAIVGYASVQSRFSGVLSLAMAIIPDARGKGGGRALVETILGWARECGAHKVDLEVWTDNARAIALYAGAGFEVEGLRRDHYRRGDGRLRSTLIMAMLLTERA
jgi:RimJ/RimL family protein N-acetyltransferase